MKYYKVVVTYEFQTTMSLDIVNALFFDVLFRGIRTPNLPKPKEIKVVNVDTKKEVITEDQLIRLNRRGFFRFCVSEPRETKKGETR